MQTIPRDRRANRRYNVHLPLYYRLSKRGEPVQTGSGMTREMSIDGLSFRCRRTLPVGAHIDVTVDWPVKHDDIYPIDLHLTGFVVRSQGNRSAIRITSRKFRVADMPAQPIRASA